MAREQLFPMIRGNVAELLSGYVDAPDIVPPSLGSRAGVLGAMALAEAMLIADSVSTAGEAA